MLKQARGAAGELVRLGRHEEAVPAYRRAVELDPGSAEAHAGLAIALYMTGRTAEAKRARDRAVELGHGTEQGRHEASEGWGA